MDKITAVGLDLAKQIIQVHGIVQLVRRIGYHKTLVAIANKHAHIIWALLARDQALNLARAVTGATRCPIRPDIETQSVPR